MPMVRGLPIIFGQRDFTQLLGFSPNVTIASAGCFLTSFAMVARYYGKVTDPVALNREIKSNNLYIGTDELADDMLTKIYPDIVFQESLLYPNDPPTPADLEKLKELMADPTLSVILEIDIGGGNTHFVVCVGVNGTVTIANPWDKQQEDFSLLYGDPIKNILKFVVYKGTPASIDQQLLDQLRQQRDKNWDLYQEQLAVNQKVQDQLAGMQTQLDAVQSKYDADEQEIITLNGALQTLTGTNKDYATESYNAQSRTRDLESYLDATAERLGIQPKNLGDKDIEEKILANVDSLNKILDAKDIQIQRLSQSPKQQLLSTVKSPGFWHSLHSFFFT